MRFPHGIAEGLSAAQCFVETEKKTASEQNLTAARVHNILL
jgi:hypothetical protein